MNGPSPRPSPRRQRPPRPTAVPPADLSPNRPPAQPAADPPDQRTPTETPPASTGESDPRLMTLTQAARYLGVSRDTFRQWHRRGALPDDVAVTIGVSTLFRRIVLARLAGETP